LGIWHLRSLNKALVWKWLWRFSAEPDALWRKVVVCKYGAWQGEWYFNAVRGPYSVGLWEHIRYGWDEFASCTRLEVSDGSQVLFWKDRWIGLESLFTKYPELFHFARDKDVMVSDCVEWTNGQLLWGSSFEGLKIGRLNLWYFSLLSFMLLRLGFME
jgi:hypothetical protein